jgi:hypothetical protein
MKTPAVVSDGRRITSASSGRICATILLALVIAAGLAWAEFYKPSEMQEYRYLGWFGSLKQSGLSTGVSIGGGEVVKVDHFTNYRISTHELLIRTASSQTVSYTNRSLVSGAGVLPFVVLAVAVTTLFAARLWRMGVVGGAILAAAGIAASVVGIPYLGGLLTGLGHSQCSERESFEMIYYLASRAAAALVCGFVAFTWWGFLRAFPEEESLAKMIMRVRPGHQWCATVAAWFLTGQCVLLAAGMSVMSGVFSGMIAATVVVGALTTALMLLIALVRGRVARWAWVPLACTILLGPPVGAGIVLLMAGLCARPSWRAGDTESRPKADR